MLVISHVHLLPSCYSDNIYNAESLWRETKTNAFSPLKEFPLWRIKDGFKITHDCGVGILIIPWSS